MFLTNTVQLILGDLLLTFHLTAIDQDVVGVEGVGEVSPIFKNNFIFLGYLPHFAHLLLKTFLTCRSHVIVC